MMLVEIDSSVGGVLLVAGLRPQWRSPPEHGAGPAGSLPSGTVATIRTDWPITLGEHEVTEQVITNFPK